MAAEMIVYDSAEIPAYLASALTEFQKDYPLSTDGPGLKVSFCRADGLSVALAKDGRTARIGYSRLSEALRGIGHLLGGVVAPGGELWEKPTFQTMGIMLDCSRNAVMQPHHFKLWLRRLAAMGYNMAMLYTEDTYELKDEPYFGYMRGSYTPEELREIDAYAAVLGIEMIPCIQTLGHLANVLKWADYKSVKDTDHVLMVDEEKTYVLIEKMIVHWKSVYRTRRIHVGLDETMGMGRGAYFDRFGLIQEYELFNRHLQRVVGICTKHGLKPMMWSDRFFTMGTLDHAYYAEDARIPVEVAAGIPREVELVYWDYYRWKKEDYAEWVRRHREAGFDPLMGSGVWTWGRFWYDHHKTENAVTACVDGCREAGVKEIFFTLWGDDGAYCDFDSAFAGLLFSAEKALCNQIDPAYLARKFAAICFGSYEKVVAFSGVNRELNAPSVLWDDPLLLMNLKQERAKDADSLARAAGTYRLLADAVAHHQNETQAGDLGYAYLLADALARKTALAHDLLIAYDRRDELALRELLARLVELKEHLRCLLARFRSNWLRRYKPFGLEVIQIRFGGQLARLDELEARIWDLLDNRLSSIPELEVRPDPVSLNQPLWSYNRVASGCCW